ncbi:hypothetical protein AVEN_99436-1 [Araneus ventricosus]|uniref:Reverse transcriptase domain-containing protein n=1 Tax=Araneus ventricosus TaxID=182803 RepID=A0A4Y2J8P2_ARAVE|nr:hypothetical protein AVEN_99436-1 [Araneus ventricosus]
MEGRCTPKTVENCCSVRKPNKANFVGSYRPYCSHICMPCKLMELVILKKITITLWNLNLIPEEQYGFRRGHSTVSQILYFAQVGCPRQKPTMPPFLCS